MLEALSGAVLFVLLMVLIFVAVLCVELIIVVMRNDIDSRRSKQEQWWEE